MRLLEPVAIRLYRRDYWGDSISRCGQFRLLHIDHYGYIRPTVWV